MSIWCTMVDLGGVDTRPSNKECIQPSHRVCRPEMRPLGTDFWAWWCSHTITLGDGVQNPAPPSCTQLHTNAPLPSLAFIPGACHVLKHSKHNFSGVASSREAAVHAARRARKLSYKLRWFSCECLWQGHILWPRRTSSSSRSENTCSTAKGALVKQVGLAIRATR